LSVGPINPYFDALAVGFLYGLVFCTSTCLPYVAGYIAGLNAGFRLGVKVTLIFNLGRIVAYAIIGTVVGLFKLVVSDVALSSFQKFSSPVFGLITIIMGVVILYRVRSSGNSCGKEIPKKMRILGGSLGFDLGAFVLGLSRGLVLCTPLMLLLGYSVPFGSPFDSLALALLFGLGTALSPIFLLGGATGWLLNKAPLFRQWVSIGGAALLIVLGVLAVINATII
jgi:sulfite exporter TauE/SafE